MRFHTSSRDGKARSVRCSFQQKDGQDLVLEIVRRDLLNDPAMDRSIGPKFFRIIPLCLLYVVTCSSYLSVYEMQTTS